MLRLDNITVKFGESTVLENFSTDLSDSRIVAIVGPSGCGKTTLLNVISGLLKPNSGRVTTDESFVVMFQEPRLFPHLTALENVNVVLSDKKETYPLAKELLLRVGITDFDKYPDELSGGMKQRVALARTLAGKASTLILDEPFASLDSDSRSELLEIVKKDGRRVIFVTHDMDDIKIADKIIKL
ncbi:MAG: ABC transporter ATP-binding protein [Clostridia bacterium]|nr:ABC transporter ATP-binding protein [Clostridia bacterium]